MEKLGIRHRDKKRRPAIRRLFHTHSHDSIAVRLTDSKVQEQPAGGEWRPASRVQPGDSRYMEGTNKPYTHRVKNVGNTLFPVIDVELLGEN